MAFLSIFAPHNFGTLTALCKLVPGKFVRKKFKEDQVPEIENLFSSMEIHTR